MVMIKKPLRNWVAMDPLMRKGGAHQVARRTLRPRFDKGDALDDFAEWRDDELADISGEQKEGPQGPSSFPAFIAGMFACRANSYGRGGVVLVGVSLAGE